MMKQIFSKNYKLLLFGNAISDFGDILYSVAIGYWVYAKTNSTALMGIMSSISMFVQMALLPISGTVIDRIDRKKTIVITDVIRGLLMIGCGIFALNDSLSVSIVLLIALLTSFCSLFFNPAVDTVLIDLLNSDTIVKGQSIYNAVNSFIQLSSKAISGALIAILGVGWIIILNGISFLLSAFSEMFINLNKRDKQTISLSIKVIINDLKQGLKVLLSNSNLTFFMSIALVINLLGSGVQSLFMAWVLDIGFDVKVYGYISAIQTCAYMGGTLFLSTVNLTKKQTYFLFKYGFILSGISSIIMYGSTNIYIITVSSVLKSLGLVIANSIFNAKLMMIIPNDSKGSIIGLFSTCTIGASAMSSIIIGLLCDYIPIPLVFIASSAITLIPLSFMVYNSKAKDFIFN